MNGEGTWIWEELVDGVNMLEAQNTLGNSPKSKPIVTTG